MLNSSANLWSSSVTSGNSSLLKVHPYYSEHKLCPLRSSEGLTFRGQILIGSGAEVAEGTSEEKEGAKDRMRVEMKKGEHRGRWFWTWGLSTGWLPSDC